MLERYLIEHCSPTLASLKSGSLFSCAFDCECELQTHLDVWNRELNPKGVELYLLKKQRNTALIYVFRRSRLQADLSRPGVRRFLMNYGYESLQPDDALKRLKCRLAHCDGFPHEIGLFLSYPLGDVVGFIENGGRNCKCTGCWKVYCNACEAMRTFDKFNKCRDVYTRLWREGSRSVLQLTVAA